MMDAMLKMMGVDPEQMREHFEAFKLQVIAMDARLTRIEAKMDAILALHKPPVLDAPVPAPLEDVA